MRSGLHSLRDVIPASEACQYGHINWSLAQTQQHSSMHLCQSFPPKRGGKRPVPGSSGPSSAKRPHLESGNEAHPNGKKSAGGNVSTGSTNTRRKGSMGVSTPDVSWSSASSSSSSAFFWVGMLLKFFYQWRCIT